MMIVGKTDVSESELMQVQLESLRSLVLRQKAREEERVGGLPNQGVLYAAFLLSYQPSNGLSAFKNRQ